VIAGAGVLAAAYRGKDISERALLVHAVSDEPVARGRLRRDAREAFCDRKLDLVDEGGWQTEAEITCPKCLAILAR
jgi:hypothetical protein